MVPYVAAAMGIAIALPEKGTYIVDNAGMIAGSTREAITVICERLRIEENIPLVVVTVSNLDEGSSRNRSIDSFSRALFEQWGNDHSFEFRDSWRRGMLLLVAADDRKVRIELGANWEGKYNDQCDLIMQQRIISSFKKRAFSTGILQGVNGLEAMSQGVELPPGPSLLLTLFQYVLGLSVIVGAPVAFINLVDWQEKRNDPVGYANRKAEDAAMFATIRANSDPGYDDSDDTDNRASSWSSGSDYGGGGGATGSW